MWCTRLIGNFHATDVQHTCNTTCNTTTFPVNFQSKWLSGHFRRPKATSKGKGDNFAPSRENHRNLQQKCSCCTSCCTCVARVLHVCCMCFLRDFCGVTKILCWRQALGALCTSFVAGAIFRVARGTLVSAWQALCPLSEPCDSSPICCHQAILPVRWTNPRTVRNSRGPSSDTNHGQWCRL